MPKPNNPHTDAADSAALLSARHCAFALLQQRLTIDGDSFDDAAERVITQMQATYDAHLDLNDGDPSNLVLSLIHIATVAIRVLGDTSGETEQAILAALREDMLA